MDRKKWALHKWIILLLLFSSPGVFAQTTILSQKELNILTLGDSNGTFPHSWPQQLKLALPNAQVYNVSKSGRTIGFPNGDSTLTSLWVIDKNLKDAAEFTGNRPYNFIIIELGTNEAKAIFADKQTEVPGHMQLLISKIKNCDYPAIHNAKIVIISPPPYGTKAEATEKYHGGQARVKAMSRWFKKVARANDCLFVDGFTTPGLNVETMTADGLHLDAAGSRKLIEPVVALITK